MKLCIEDYKPQELLDKTFMFIYDEWKRLQEEFPEIKTERLFIMPTIDYLEMFRTIHSGVPELKDSSKLVEAFKANIAPGELMAVYLVGRDFTGSLMQYVHMTTERLTEALFMYLADYDTFMQMLKVALRHEVGHLLVNIDIDNRHKNDLEGFAKEYYGMLEESKKITDPLFKEYKDKRFDESFYKIYFNSPIEKAANDMVGISWNTQWELEKKLTKAWFGEERKDTIT